MHRPQHPSASERGSEHSNRARLRWVSPTRALAVGGLAIFLAASSALYLWWIAEQPSVVELPREWTATVFALAGDGTRGHADGSGARARFADPFGIALGGDGLIYVADGAEGDRLRVVSLRGDVATLAGGIAGFADGNGLAARFSTPSGVAVDRSGALYVADTGNNAVRRVGPDGTTTTVAGGGVAGFRDGTGAEARFDAPIGIAVDGHARVLVADTYNDRIRFITPDGAVSTLAGSTRGFADGPASEARFDTPCGIAVAGDGTIYVADAGNDRIRAITPAGLVSTVIDPSHGVFRPLGLAAAPTGELYVVDESGRLFERSAEGTVRVIAGSTAGYRDGPGPDALFRRPAGVAWVGPGRLVVADAGNALVRLVDAQSRAELRAPASPRIAPAFDDAGFAQRPILWPIDPQYGPFEVAGTMGEARGEEAYRFHAGVDVRAEQGLDVLAVRDGVIQAPISTADFGSLNESLRVGPVSYVHIRAGRDTRGRVKNEAHFVATRDDTGRLVDIRAKRGRACRQATSSAR